MTGLTNYRYEGAMIPFLAILTIFLFVRHATSAEVNKRFRYLTLSTLVATTLAVASGFLEGSMQPLPYLMLTTLYYAAANWNGYLLLSYVAVYVRYENKRFMHIFHVALLVSFFLLAVNLATGYFFSVNAQGLLVKGPQYTLSRSFFIFLFVGVAFALQNIYQQFYGNAQFILMNLLFFLLIDAFVVQHLFVDSIQIVYLVATAILFSTFFYLEVPTLRRIEEAERELSAVLNDVEHATERTQAASRAKSDFLANTSHEIRTPMNAILGMNEMILKKTHDDETAHAAHDVKRAGEHLLNIINNILDISKVESGKMEIYPAPFFLSEIIDDIDAMFRERVEEKGLEFHVEINRDFPEHLYGDADALRRIIENLLDNAVKYTNEGTVTFHLLGGGRLQAGDEGYVENSAYPEQMHLQIMIEDTGIGMRTEEMDKLFDAFERVNLRETQNIQGAGLGLTLVQYLVKLMNGRILVESMYGEGSAFTIDLPVGIVHEGFDGTIADYEAMAAPVAETMRDYTGMKALVVDDTPVNLIVAEGLLTGLGMEVTTLDSGEACLALLQQGAQFDVVFLDHKMPGMDGVETLRRIRKTAHTKYIALTALTGSGLREQYKEYGFDDYLSKPLTEADVCRVL